MPVSRFLAASIRRLMILCWAFLPVAVLASPPAACPLAGPDAERVLFLALDGVSLRVLEMAREDGAFADWPEPVGVISTFPSMTNVAFTAMLERFGAEKIAGYETRRYDAEDNRLIGGSTMTGYPWKGMFEVKASTFGAKMSLYMSPGHHARSVLEQIEAAVLADPSVPVVFGHLASTDMLSHLRGDGATLRAVESAAELVANLQVEHERLFGRRLEVVLLSDHGNGADKVAFTAGLKDALRARGFHFGKELGDPDAIVAPTYGAVNYGVLYLDPTRAADAARAAASHESVALAAWLGGAGRMAVVGRDGEAEISWRSARSGRHFSYDVLEGDPLHLLPVRERLAAAGELDAEGFAEEEVWFRATVDSIYPNALPRLVDSLTGRWVDPAATVVLSLDPRYAWGQGSVRLGARIQTGKLEGTHGGLDAESSLGFLLASDADRQPHGVVSIEQALAGWSDLGPCIEPTEH